MLHLVLDPRDSSNSLCCPWCGPPLTLMPAFVIVKMRYTDKVTGISISCTGKEGPVISQWGEEPKSRSSLLLGYGHKMDASYHTVSYLLTRHLCSDRAQVLLCPSRVTKFHM